MAPRDTASRAANQGDPLQPTNIPPAPRREKPRTKPTARRKRATGSDASYPFSDPSDSAKPIISQTAQYPSAGASSSSMSASTPDMAGFATQNLPGSSTAATTQISRKRKSDRPPAGQNSDYPEVPGDDEEFYDDDGGAANENFADRLLAGMGQVGAEMQNLLNSMTTGDYRGADALTALYGEKASVDVAELPAYPDHDEMRRNGLQTDLHQHQSQGIAWMVRAEHRKVDAVPAKGQMPQALWVPRRYRSTGRIYWRNIASGESSREPPELPRGGILSDGMGLGKTLQVISLALTDPAGTAVLQEDEEKANSNAKASPVASSSKVEAKEEIVDVKPMIKNSPPSSSEPPRKRPMLVFPDGFVPKSQREVATSTPDRTIRVKSEATAKGESSKSFKPEPGIKPKIEKGTQSKGKSKGKERQGFVPAASDDEEHEDGPCNNTTLIVCPLSVLFNWTDQIEAHTDHSKVSCLVFHGDTAAKHRYRDLSKYTFVITTYEQLRTEYKPTAILQEIDDEEERHTQEMQDLNNRLQNAEARLARAPNDEIRALIAAEIRGHKQCIATEKQHHLEFQPESARTAGRPRKQTVAAPHDNDDALSDDSLLSDDEKEVAKAEKSRSVTERRKDGIRESTFYTTHWRRVVLDEAHFIRNAKTTFFKAAVSLKAERRWAVTGTPIINYTKDLGALCAFIQLYPLSDEVLWRKLIENNIQKGIPKGYHLLKTVVQNLVLRRMKSMSLEDGTPIVPLPPIEAFHHTIPLDPDTRIFYDKLEEAIKTRVSGWMEDGSINQLRGVMLTFLLRLRQVANDRRLIPADLVETIRTRDYAQPIAADGAMSLTDEQVDVLREALQAFLDAGDSCPICLDDPNDPVITSCSHVFCKACIRAVMSTQARCPMDRGPLPLGAPLTSLPPPPEKKEERLMDGMESDEIRSAKIDEVVKILDVTDPMSKTLIFTSHVAFLDNIAERLLKDGYPIARFDGRMDKERRNAVLRSFARPVQPNPNKSKYLAAIKAEEARDAWLKQSEKHYMALGVNKVSAKERAKKALADAERDGSGPTNPRVLLISIGSGACGLNLTSASNVFLMDPHWNSSLEQQAIDRCHRIGQTRPVKVFHLIAERTIEQRILDIQAKKEDLVIEAFAGVRNRGAAVEQARERRGTQNAGGSIEELVQMFGLDPSRIRRRGADGILR